MVLYAYTIISGQCGGQIYVNSTTTLTSLAFPSNYESNLNCHWSIDAPLGKKVTLQFLDFDLQSSEHCLSDYLKIYEMKVCNNRLTFIS